jgi:FkbM family methyltransferase
MKKSLNPGSEETLTGPGWETILWECNPQMIDWFLTDLVAQEPNVTLIPHAASTKNGQLTFFLTSGQEAATSKDEMPNPTCDPSSPYNPSGASTLYGTALRAGRNITVNTVDFLAWHQALNLQEGDTVHIKIDIEGAEVDILEVFLADPTNQMCYWHKFWNEYHKNIFPEGSPDYLVHEAFENSFPSRFEAKCGRPLPANEWS